MKKYNNIKHNIKDIVNRYQEADIDTILNFDSITYCEILFDIEKETGYNFEISSFIKCRTINEIYTLMI